jgi:hypothetical protein
MPNFSARHAQSFARKRFAIGMKVCGKTMSML